MFKTLSVVVPTKGCVFSCPFCASKMVGKSAPASIDIEDPVHKLLYVRKMELAHDLGYDSMVITSSGEALQNPGFVDFVLACNQSLRVPFKRIELQTAGAFIDNEKVLRHLLVSGVTGIALSCVNPKDDANNMEVMKVPEALRFSLKDLCLRIINQNMSLRLIVNVTKEVFKTGTVLDIYEAVNELGPDSLTFRVLCGVGDSDEAKWVGKNAITAKVSIEAIRKHIKAGGALELLPYGTKRYETHGLSVAMDEDPLAENPPEITKNLILQPNGFLYSRWWVRGSLVA